ncbi:PorT family protein [Treponema sp. TIM-1]|uniref:porin family protein n=1 Tax=Treponema sp. TIM-1 TaxID=2898417 RepID=UPI00397FE6B8
MKKVKKRKGLRGLHFPPLLAIHCSWFIFFALLPRGADAQTTPGDISAAIMPFVGDDLAISAQLQDKTTGEVNALSGYIPQPFSAEQYPEYLNLRPDEPPDPSLLGNSPFVLTGEYYVDSDELEHFQLWLWVSSTGSLVYTDEMVFENMEEAEGYLPPVVKWIFSNIAQPAAVAPEIIVAIPQEMTSEILVEIPQEVTVEIIPEIAPETVEEPAEETAEETIAEGDTGGDGEHPASPRLYLGLRGGASFNTYEIRGTGTYQSGAVKSIGLETALAAELRILRFLSVQAEAAFNLEYFKPSMLKHWGSEEIFTSDLYRVMSFQVPLLVKLPLTFEQWRPSVYLGPYIMLPLLPIKNTEGSYFYRINLPIGIIFGMDLGYTLGPGELFLDLRYEMDLGMTIVRATSFQYTQNRISMTLGYRFGLWNRQKVPAALTPEEPALNPEESVFNPEESVFNPEESMFNPEESMFNPEEPMFSPEEPVLNPEEPIFTPEEPLVPYTE